mgnify:CR=1 FL=1
MVKSPFAYGLGYFLFEAKMIQQPDSNQVVEFFAGKRFDYLELQQHNTVQKIEPKDFENLVTDSLSYYLNNRSEERRVGKEC